MLPTDECSVDPCNSVPDIETSLASSSPSPVFTCDQLEVGDVPRTWLCDDPNPFWLNDYTCSCAVDETTSQYPADVLAVCGTEEMMTTESGTLSNYQVSAWLSAAPERQQMCQVATGTSDCVAESDGSGR